MDEERLRFGDFELRPDSGELLRSGTPVKIQPQPAKVLELLARRSGEVVSREDFRRHLWGEETFVDFEHGLNFSIRQIRRALGDSAETPRFVETVPRHGYRFLPPVTVETAAPDPETAAPVATLRTRWRWMPGAAAAVVLLLVLGLVGAERASTPVRASSFQDVPKEAREAYLEGRHFSRREATPEEREKGVEAFQRATVLAPDFVDAYADLSKAEIFLPKKSWKDKLPVAEAAARKAVDLDPRQAEAHWVLGFISYLRLDIRRVQEETELALKIDPNLATAQALRANYLAILGRHDEAIAAAERTRALDPEGKAMEPDLLCYQFLLARRYSEAIDCGQHIAETAPADSKDIPWARLWALWAARLQGDSDAALDVAKAMAGQSAVPSPQRFETLRDFWPWDLRRLDTFGSHLNGERAADFLALGERERALHLLETAGYGDWSVPFLAVDPRYDSLRGDPRFEKLLQRLHLPRIHPSPRPAAGG
jgi:DNA-binding winged helix-turn-helix (wHTH) protein